MASDQSPAPGAAYPSTRHAFISYSRADQAYVHKLALYLERKGIHAWYDRKIETGESFRQAIRTAIDESCAFIFVLSHASSKPGWIDKEIDRAAARKKRIIPLLIEKGAQSSHIEVSGLNWEDVTSGNHLPPDKIIDQLKRLSILPDPKTIFSGFTWPPTIRGFSTPTLKETAPHLWQRWRSLLLAAAVGAIATYSLIATQTGMLGWPLTLTSLAGAAVSATACVVVDRRKIKFADPFKRDPAATPRVPPGQSQFRGRDVELELWKHVHGEARLKRQENGTHAVGPVILAIHGPAGTGKSVFAHALASRLRDDYPDGYFMVSFGTSGTGRSPADISRDLLLQLGWPIADMPNETEDRVATVRSLTRGARMLFLFDAARDHDQVRQVIPAEPNCAVIITSRREIASALGLSPQNPLERTSLADSLDIFSAISGYEWTRSPGEAVHVVELCGRLPLAIRSAAEQLRDGTSMERLIGSLSNEDTRLAVLEYAGSAVQERVGSEFHRLLAEQRKALTLLAQLDGDSFVPWVLRPMMDVGKSEAGAIVSNLATAQLIEEIGQDHPGRARFRLNPLVRLFAMGQLKSADPIIGPDDIDQAKAKLAEWYTKVIDSVLTAFDPSYTSVDPTPKPRSSSIDQISRSLEIYVRREYRTVLWLLTAAHPCPPLPDAMVWRCVAQLGAAVPGGVKQETMKSIFAKGIEAAEHEHRGGAATLPIADVLLAKAMYLVAIEDYPAAQDVLNDVETTLAGAPADDAPADDAVFARQLRVARIRAGAYLQAAAYDQASAAVSLALDLVRTSQMSPTTDAAVQKDLRLLQLYNAEAPAVPRDDAVWDLLEQREESTGTLVRFRATLLRSEELRARQFWHDAAGELRLAEPHWSGDARSLAVIWYRLARLQIEEAYDAEKLPVNGTPERLERLRREAIRLAAECAWTFKTIDDNVGEIRANCLLVRALVLNRQLVAATQLCYQIDERLRQLPGADSEDPPPYVRSLQARFARAQGELELECGSYQEAWNTLTSATSIFNKLGDMANAKQVWRLLDRIDANTAGGLREVLRGLRDI